MRTIRLLVLAASAWPLLALPQSRPVTCDSALCKLASSGRLPPLRWPDFSDQIDAVQRFYGPAEYEFAWLRNGRPTEAAYKVIQLLTEADQKGLRPEDYEASQWEERIHRLTASSAKPGDSDLAAFDLALTVCALRYVSHLHFGRTNPEWLHDVAGLTHEEVDVAGIVRSLMLPGADVRAKIEAVEPPYESYRQTKKALQKYIALAKADHDEPLPVTDKPLDPQTPYPAATQLAAKLKRLGDLPETAEWQEGVYGGPLVNAVKRFQMRHGLDTDGRVGKATFAALNTPLQQRIGQLERTLERWRWVPHRFPRPPIVVNIPEFDLRALNDQYTTELEMKVVVGKAYQTETPVFAAQMKSVIFRPYWNVPMSIQRKELLPKLLKDREYLLKERYEVVTVQEKVVSEGAVDDTMLADLRSGKLHLRQRPGPDNALGLIKFNLPNAFDVYMHDTPATSLFSRARRDFSHGCIRVERPKRLAEWVLRNQAEWTPEKISEAMQGAKTFEVPLMHPIPVLIVYATAVVPSTGEVLFFDDIYGEDARLEKILNDGPPYARETPTNDGPGPRPRE